MDLLLFNPHHEYFSNINWFGGIIFPYDIKQMNYCAPKYINLPYNLADIFFFGSSLAFSVIRDFL